jgi:hypothetical protein
MSVIQTFRLAVLMICSFAGERVPRLVPDFWLSQGLQFAYLADADHTFIRFFWSR